MAPRRRLGIMGGTFDPIHYGHLVTAEEARVQFGLEQVIFVPNRHPPHKDPREVTDPEHRYLMTFLATATNPHFTISRLEIEREGPSYTIDTIVEFKRRHPDEALSYITGADAILQILRGEWEDSPRLLALCDFIAATRPGFVLDHDAVRANNVTGRRLDNIHFMEIPALAISSTDIRRRVALGRPIKYLVPEPVESYIVQHGLYGAAAPTRAEARRSPDD
ncbi:MAG: nicotinate-nucleotide adenylyltransferase, nicotinate-nucleotide adenylyltransferase [Armatimonadetes bacterium CSP1-3]|nr:MAG: nicotinate-nucleotide adenylyltransferase, nicotinate-nucleotide adenylyltransferase [Armatimonadetes bacterium CSP1-3]